MSWTRSKSHYYRCQRCRMWKKGSWRRPSRTLRAASGGWRICAADRPKFEKRRPFYWKKTAWGLHGSHERDRQKIQVVNGTVGGNSWAAYFCRGSATVNPSSNAAMYSGFRPSEDSSRAMDDTARTVCSWRRRQPRWTVPHVRRTGRQAAELSLF